MGSEVTPSPVDAVDVVVAAELGDAELGDGELGELMTPAEVAQAFGVDPKTVARWARSGKLSHVRTLGGHRRYLRSEITALLNPRGVQPPA